MLNFVFTLIALAGLLLSIGLMKAYAAVPPRELKRRALKGDDVAMLLHRVVTHGVSARIVLWGLIGLWSAAVFTLLNATLNSFFAYIGTVLVIWLSFAWLPNARVSRVTASIAKFVSPLFAWLLSKMHPLLRRLEGLSRKRVYLHTGVFESDDFVRLIQRQRNQHDNRIDPNQLDMVEHALLLDTIRIRDFMTPRKVVDQIGADEPISTLLLDELYKKGHSRLPVYDGNIEHIIGILYLKSLLGAKNGTVRTHMDKEVYYVNEEQTLMQALDAFLKTERHLFIVVNTFEEFVGIITIEDVLEQVIGRQIVDEFDQYDNMRAVAAMIADKERAARSSHNVENIVE